MDWFAGLVAMGGTGASLSQIPPRVIDALKAPEGHFLRGVALRGDAVIRQRNEPTPISIQGRVEAIVASHWSATVAPTGTSRQAYAAAAAAFDVQLRTLRTLVDTDLRALQEAMEKAGAPWTPGRVPTWTRE